MQQVESILKEVRNNLVEQNNQYDIYRHKCNMSKQTTMINKEININELCEIKDETIEIVKLDALSGLNTLIFILINNSNIEQKGDYIDYIIYLCSLICFITTFSCAKKYVQYRKDCEKDDEYNDKISFLKDEINIIKNYKKILEKEIEKINIALKCLSTLPEEAKKNLKLKI